MEEELLGSEGLDEMCDDSDDEDLAIRMMCGDSAALREVLNRHFDQVKQLLSGIYKTTVQQMDIDEAMNRAIFKMWNNAGTFEKSKGNLAAWLFMMAQSAVIDIFRKEKQHRRKHPLLPDEFEVADECVSEVQLSPKEERELKELDNIIETKLKGHQQAIIKADLAVGGSADAGSLAERLNTSKDSIYVSRNKAHENIRKELMLLEQTRERMRGMK